MTSRMTKSDSVSSVDQSAASPPKVRVNVPACPICSQPMEPRYRPFCSRRCADVDLGRWFGERYRVESNETPELSEESEA